jgi:hypothetical protein
MAKRQSFADKASKKVHRPICKVCGKEADAMLVVMPVQSARSRTLKLRDRMVICDCQLQKLLAE